MNMNKNINLDTLEPLKTVEEEKTSLCPPWVEYFNKLKCMFGDDPDIHMEQQFNGNIMLIVNDMVKMEALSKLLPGEKAFGNKVCKIMVTRVNEETSPLALLRRALAGNPHFVRTVRPDGMLDRPFNFIVFEKGVAQYYNDNLGDVKGCRSLLYSDLASEIFGDAVTDPTIRFCTDVDEAVDTL